MVKVNLLIAEDMEMSRATAVERILPILPLVTKATAHHLHSTINTASKASILRKVDMTTNADTHLTLSRARTDKPLQEVTMIQRSKARQL